MTDIPRIRALAEQATPGPWSAHCESQGYPDDGQWFVSSPTFPDCQAVVGSESTNGGNDARYMAAASPDVVLALLDELETLRAALWELLATHGDPCRLGDDCPAVTMARAALAGSGR